MSKTAGFLIFLVIVALGVTAYFVNRSQNPEEETVETETKQAEEAVVVPTPDMTRVMIYAAGTEVDGIYPTMELYIGENKVQTWEGVKGDPAQGKFDQFEYVHGQPIGDELLEIAYVNDVYVTREKDRNLYVDRMVIGDRIYVADSPATLTTTDNQQSNGCEEGITYSRWLKCNGRFTFRSYEKAFVPTPTPEGAIVNGSMVRVYAAGQFGGGDFPSFDLNIKGKRVANFAGVAGNPAKRELMEYSVMYPGNIAISDISISYVNDYFKSEADDRNLYIDRININGVDYPADEPNVYKTGLWIGGRCIGGYYPNKLLSCPGATMRFGDRLSN